MPLYFHIMTVVRSHAKNRILFRLKAYTRTRFLPVVKSIIFSLRQTTLLSLRRSIKTTTLSLVKQMKFFQVRLL